MKVCSKRSSIYFIYTWTHSASLRLYQGASAFSVFNPLHNMSGVIGMLSPDPLSLWII